MKGRGLFEDLEFQKALDVYTDILEIEPENEEAKKELAKTQQALKKYHDKESNMFKKMFIWDSIEGGLFKF